jgi:hypothetical protein
MKALLASQQQAHAAALDRVAANASVASDGDRRALEVMAAENSRLSAELRTALARCAALEAQELQSSPDRASVRSVCADRQLTTARLSCLFPPRVTRDALQSRVFAMWVDYCVSVSA